MSQYAVGYGEFSGRINAGVLDRSGQAFTAKQDCTDQALLAVAIYTLRHDGEVTVTDEHGNAVLLRAELKEDDEHQDV